MEETSDLLRSMKILDQRSQRWGVKAQELVATLFGGRIKAVWSWADVRAIQKEYDLQGCIWTNYIGYAPPDVEQMALEIGEYTSQKKLDADTWDLYEIIPYVLCDENLIARKKVDPFFGIVVGLHQDVEVFDDAVFFLLHKWGPDVTAERKEIVVRKHSAQQKKPFWGGW